jgi:hypothetical protein
VGILAGGVGARLGALEMLRLESWTIGMESTSELVSGGAAVDPT